MPPIASGYRRHNNTIMYMMIGYCTILEYDKLLLLYSTHSQAGTDRAQGFDQNLMLLDCV